jgi:hypothetical protein
MSGVFRESFEDVAPADHTHVAGQPALRYAVPEGVPVVPVVAGEIEGGKSTRCSSCADCTRDRSSSRNADRSVAIAVWSLGVTTPAFYHWR